MRDRCPQHGIALADDGKCVLCRRTSRPTTAELYGGSADQGGPPGVVVTFVSVLAVVAVVAAIVVVTRGSLKPVSVAAEPGARITPSSASSSGGVGPPAASGNAPSPAFTERGEAPTPPPVASVKWVSEPVSDEVEGGSSAVAAAKQVERARVLARQQAEFEAWAHREANREIEEQEERARRNRAESPSAAFPGPGMRGGKPVAADVLRRVPVTMYSASWCGACSAARAFFQGTQIPFMERDVDTDPFAASEARRLNPKGSIPTIDVAGTTIIGFRPGAIMAAIENAAGRR